MPTSKKRVKRTKEEKQARLKSANIVKHPLGKVVILTLALGFVLSLIVSLIVVLVEAMQA